MTPHAEERPPYQLSRAEWIRIKLLQELLDSGADVRAAFEVAQEVEEWLIGKTTAAVPDASLREMVRAEFSAEMERLPAIISEVVKEQVREMLKNYGAPVPSKAETAPVPAAAPPPPSITTPAIPDRPVTENERKFLADLNLVKLEEFRARDVSEATGRTSSHCATLLNMLAHQGFLQKLDVGLYARLGYVMPIEEEDGRAPPPPRPSAAPPSIIGPPVEPLRSTRKAIDPLQDVVDWMTERGEDIAPKDGIYLRNGRIRMSPETLIETANRMRLKSGLKLFSMEKAA